MTLNNSIEHSDDATTEALESDSLFAVFSRYLMAPDPDVALGTLLDLPAFRERIPYVTALDMSPRPGFHHKDALRHTLTVVAQISDADLLARWGALLHDIGKPATRKYHGEPFTRSAVVSFTNHEHAGAALIPRIATAVEMPEDFARDLRKVVALHMRPRNVSDWSDSAIRRYITQAGTALTALNKVARADVTSRYQANHDRVRTQMDLLEHRIEEVTRLDALAARRPPIDGTQVARYLGIEPGPRLGVYMNALYARVTDSNELLTVTEAYEIVDAVTAEQFG